MSLQYASRHEGCLIRVSAVIASIVGFVYRIRLYQATDIGMSSATCTLCGYGKITPHEDLAANLRRIVESGISIICSSMPAMAAFSKLHVAKFTYLTSLRSRLVSRYRASTEKINAFRPSKGSTSIHSNSSSSNGDSLSQLHGSGDVELCETRETKATAEIRGAASRSGCVHDGILKSVSVEQSSDEISL